MATAKRTTPTRNTATCVDEHPDLAHCRGCRRRIDPDSWSKVRLCERCEAQARRRQRWANADPDRLIELAESIGVGRVFCRGGQLPTFDDPGLRERLAAHPLPQGGIIAVGPVGSHKSHLLAGRTIDAAGRGWSARFLSWTRFALEVRDTYKASATETELDVLERYAGLDYLALDDLGVGSVRTDGRESEAARLLAYTLLDARYAACRVTDVSSNATPSELTERFDARIGRRLAELCSTYPMFLADGKKRQSGLDRVCQAS